MKRGNWFYISIITATLLYIILLNVGAQRNEREMLKDKRIIVVLKSVAQPMDFWDVVKSGMEEASRESGITLEFTGPAHEYLVDEQIRLFYEAIEKKPDLIILASSDFERLKTPVSYAQRMSIPILTMDSSVNSTIPIGFVATDNVEAGIKAGRALAKILDSLDLGREPNVMIMSHSKGTSTAIDRETGVRIGLQGHHILGTWYCNIDYQMAYDLTVQLLQEYQIDAIVGLNEVSTLGVADAVYELGLGRKIPIVGFDNAAREMAYLESGVLSAVVVQRPYNMGYLSIKKAEDFLLGKEVEPFLNTGSIVITQENMFEPEYQEVLFPYDKLSQ